MNAEQLREELERSDDVDWQVADEPLELERRLGYLPSEGVPPLRQQMSLAAQAVAAPPPPAPTYPPSVDLRAAPAGNMITAVRDQENCSSCVAFASCAAVEGTLRLERGDPSIELDLSEAYLFYCTAAAEGRDCSDGESGGWYPKKALEAFAAEGTPDEACFPYVAGNQPCSACEDRAARSTTIAGWKALHAPAEMKAWIAERGPVVASMTVFEDFSLYSGGVYSHIAGAEKGGHCICVVGYDEPGSHWIVKNSWGTGWGESGFFRIAYGQCGIDSGMLGVEGVQPPQGRAGGTE